MKAALFTFLLLFACATTWSQEASNNSDNGRIRPIEVTDPVEYPREQVSGDLDALVQPVLPVREVTVQTDVIRTRFDRHESVKLTIPEVDPQHISREWSKFFKKAADGKMKSQGKSTRVTEVEFDEVSGGLMDVDLQFDSNPESVFVWVAMERDSAIVKPSELTFSEMQKLMHARGLEDYREYVRSEIDREEKILEKMKSEYQSLIRDNQKKHDRIDNFNSRIVEDNNALDINTSNIADAEASLADLNTQLGEATAENEKTLGKEVKKAERELKGYQNNGKKLNTRLLSYEEEILEDKASITANLDAQRDKILRIREQELLVEAYKVKLDGIL